MDNNGQLINYIVQELKRGVPEQGIRSALLQSGWPTEPVDRAFSILRQGEIQALQPAAELPDIRAARAVSRPQALSKPNNVAQTKQRRPFRKLLAAILVLALITSAALVIFLLKPSPTPQPADSDAERKNMINALGEDLSTYYSATGTYPTIDQLNSPKFASTQDGFEVTNYRDPSWKAQDAKCKEGTRAILTANRAKGCYTYRTTALNGDECNATDKKCTRVVLMATLDSGKPYIVALDQNKPE
jgi:hypothetical protein